MVDQIAPKTKYLDWLYKTDYNEEPFNDLDKLLEYAVEIINRL